MSCSMLTRDGRNLLQLLVDSAPCFEETNTKREIEAVILSKDSEIQKFSIENTFSNLSYNVIALYLVKQTRLLNDMKLHENCNHASESLSFSHKAASKGLIILLTTIEKQFGIHAFNCLNKNNITTSILMRFFNHFYKFPLFLRSIHVLPEPDMIASFFLKILMDFKPFFFPKYSVEKKCNYRIRNFRNISDMGICGLKLEKEFLSFLQQYVRISGVKSKKDIAEMLSKTLWQSKCEADTCSNEFVNVLATIKRLNENPKAYLDLSNNIFDKTLKLLNVNGCLNSSSSKNISKVISTNCCKWISLITRLKKILKSSYSIIKNKKMFLLFSLYQNQLNVPFEHSELLINDNWDVYQHFCIDFSQNMFNIKPEFHMQKKYDIWNWFKSCKNCNAKEMIKQISVSTVREIQQWKGSPKNFFSPFSKNPAFTHTSEETKMPLKQYYSHDNEKEI